MDDRVVTSVDEWAVTSDGIQWMLCQHRMDRGKVYWRPVSFVRSTRDILARCMREKGVPGDVARYLLSRLPDSFDEWKANHVASSDAADRAEQCGP